MEADESKVRRALSDEAERVAGLGSYAWDMTTGDLLWSDNCFRMLGYDPGSVEPSVERFYGRVHPDDLERLQAATAAAMETEVAPPIRYRMVIDGAVRHMLSKAVAVRGDGGEVLRMVGTIQDQTHAHETQSALEEHTHLLEQAQQIANVGSWVWRPATESISWSPELYRIMGVDMDHPLSVGSFDEQVHPDDLPGLQALRASSLADGVPRPAEVRIVRRDGGVRWIRMQGRAIHDDPLWLLGVVHDITDQHHLTEQLQHRRTLEAVGTLASGVAHDFNNLLTVIMGNVRMAAEEAPGPELDDALLAAEAAAELTQRLLSLGRTSQLPLSPLDLDAAVSGAERLLRTALPEGVTLNLHTAARATVKGDRRQLDQLLLNLVLNARDAVGPEGTITVRTRAHDQEVVLEVIDDGHGMGDDVKERAAEPFFTTKGPGLGSGLGLAMVKGVVSHMGGELHFDGTPGGGTTVVLRLPKSQAPPVPKRPSTAEHALAGCRVLVVEDEPAVRRLAARVLRQQGMKVQTAAGPEEARTYLDEPFDVVLCDVAMPGGGGARVLDDFAPTEAPFVFMTGYAERDDWLQGHPVLTKPFLPQALLQHLQAAVQVG